MSDGREKQPLPQANPPARLPLEYPAGATLSEKLEISTARAALTKLLARVAALAPVGFAGPDAGLIDALVAARECMRRDAPVLATLPAAVVDGATNPVLSDLAR